MEEIWKDIKGYENKYQVSNLGRIRSYPNKRHSNFKILKQAKNNGYYTVCLSKENKTKNFTVHRLVAIAFIPNPNNLPQVGHKDEKNLINSEECNNCVENLEWCTGKENDNMPLHRERLSGKNNPMYGQTRKVSKETKEKISKAISGKNNPFYGKTHSKEAKEKMSKARKGRKLKEETKTKISKSLSIPILCVEQNIIYYGANEAERQTGVFATSITQCCKGRAKTAGGYHWRYANIEK